MSAGGRSASRGRLRWLCRRGARELDILLTRFLDTGYDALDEGGRDHFGRLLEQSDADLLAWFTGRSTPGDNGLREIVERILAGPDDRA